jgi:hypothetical protein
MWRGDSRQGTLRERHVEFEKSKNRTKIAGIISFNSSKISC